MPWEETDQYIRSGHGDPSKLDPKSMRTITLSDKKGIKAIIGCPKGHWSGGKCNVGTVTQSYLFDKSKGWTLEKAKAWFNSHKREEEVYKEEELGVTKEARWTRAYINDLPDSSFAYIEPGGKKDKTGRTVPRYLRHLPYKDKNGNIDPAHLRNAIARVQQPTIHGGKVLERGGKRKALAKLCQAVRTWNRTHPKQKIMSDVCGVKPTTKKADIQSVWREIQDAFRKMDEGYWYTQPGQRGLGVPRTDEERKLRHLQRYGTTVLPPRGTGLKLENVPTKAYCVKCKKMVTIKNPKKTTINGRNAVQGVCPTCGTKVTAFY